MSQSAELWKICDRVGSSKNQIYYCMPTGIEKRISLLEKKKKKSGVGELDLSLVFRRTPESTDAEDGHILVFATGGGGFHQHDLESKCRLPHRGRWGPLQSPLAPASHTPASFQIWARTLASHAQGRNIFHMTSHTG